LTRAPVLHPLLLLALVLGVLAVGAVALWPREGATAPTARPGAGAVEERGGAAGEAEADRGPLDRTVDPARADLGTPDPAEGAATGRALELAGRVVDEASKAGVAGAEVRLFGGAVGPADWVESDPDEVALAGGDGAYRLAWTAEGPVYQWAVAVAEGYLPCQRFVDEQALDSAGRARAFDFELVRAEEGAQLSGRVTDEQGRGLAAHLELRSQRGVWSGWREARRVERVGQAAGDGSFALAGLPPGPFRLIVTCEGFRSWTRNLQLSAREVSGLGTLVLARRAEDAAGAATLVGSVATSDGTPLPGVVVEARERSQRKHETVTEGDGAFALEVPSGAIWITLRAEARPDVLARLELPAGGVVAFDYRYPSGAHVLGGQVVAPAVGGRAGRPLPGIRAVARTAVVPGEPMLRLAVETDEEGGFLLEGIPDGRVDLLLEWDQPYVDVFVQDVAVDRTDHRFTFPFPEIVEVEGTARDARGAPLAGVVILAAGEAGARTETAADGSYRVAVPMTSQQSQRFTASLEGHLAVTAHFLRERGGVERRIRWDPTLVAEADLGEIAGRIVGEGGAPLVGVRVGVFAEEGGQTVARTFCESDSAGEYRALGVRPGAVQLVYTGDGHHELVDEVELAPRQVLRRDVTLQPVARGALTLQVVDRHGQAMSGVAWSAWCFHPRREAEGVTGNDGWIELADWPFAEGRVDLDAAGVPSHQLFLRPGQVAGTLSLPLSGGTEVIQGTVLDAAGSAVVGAGVILTTQEVAGLRVFVYGSTDGAGRFRFENLAPGAYECTLDTLAAPSVAARAGGTEVELRRGW